jgi:hypothetical protein
MIRYVFAEDRVIAIKNADKANPQKLGEAIEKIGKRNNGKIDPEMLWREAQGNPKHPAYIHYEWDVQKAAESHWTDTSRRIIRAIVPLDAEGEEMAIPAFISANTGGGVGYRHYTEVMESDQLRKTILDAAERELLAFQQRYRRFKELFASLEPAIETTRKLRDKSKDDRRKAA